MNINESKMTSNVQQTCSTVFRKTCVCIHISSFVCDLCKKRKYVRFDQCVSVSNPQLEKKTTVKQPL